MERYAFLVKSELFFKASSVQQSLLYLSSLPSNGQDSRHSTPTDPQPVDHGVKLLSSKHYLRTDGF